MFSPVTTLTAFISALCLFVADYYFSDKVAQSLSVTRNWSVSEYDFWAHATHASTAAFESRAEDRVLLLGNSFAYMALGDAGALSDVLSEDGFGDRKVFDLTSGGQTLVEAAALLEAASVNANTTILWGLNEISFSSGTPGIYRNVTGLPFPEALLDCDTVTCDGWPPRFYLRRIKSLFGSGAPLRTNRFPCESYRLGCPQEFLDRRVGIYSGIETVTPEFATDLNRLAGQVQDLSGAQIVFLELPINADFVDAVANDVYFEDARTALQTIAQTHDIPIVRSPGREDEEAQFFKDYGHIANQEFRDRIVRHVAATLGPILSGTESE